MHYTDIFNGKMDFHLNTPSITLKLIFEISVYVCYCSTLDSRIIVVKCC